MNSGELMWIDKARVYATAAHTAVGQLRKYTNEPYISHPREVFQILFNARTVSWEMGCAAWLHDVVEDTGVTIEDIEKEFGENVAVLVRWLTDISKPEDGNRKARKAIDREHFAKAPPDAKTVKLADIISNTRTIAKYDDEFAKVYMAEKEAMLDVLRDGDETLWNMARQIIIPAARACQ